MKRVLKLLDLRLEESFLVASMIAMTLIIVFQVVMRKVFNNSQVWSEEIARFIFIWQVWVAVSYAARISKHIRVDVLRDVIKAQWVKTALDVIFLVSSIAFFAFLGYKGAVVVGKIKAMNQLSPACLIPMWIPYLAVPVGCFLASLRFLQQLYLLLRGQGGPGAGPKEVAE